MSGGGNTSTTTKTELPKWYEDATKANLKFANTVADRPFEQYTTDPNKLVAGQTADQMAAYNQVRNMPGTQAAYGSAIGAAQNVAGYNPSQVQAGSFLNGNISAYMNPYQQQVIDTTMGDIDRQRQMSITGGQANATQAGAFGGSRHGVSDSLTNEAALRQSASTSAQLRQAGYGQAADMMNNDLSRSMQAQQLNQQAGLTGAALNLDAANSMGNLAAQGQQAGLQQAAALQSAGQSQQAYQQAIFDAQRGIYNEQRDYPLQQLNIRSGALQGAQLPTSQSTNGPGGSSAMGFLGGALGGASLAGTLGGAAMAAGPIGWGAAGLGGLLGAFG